MKLANFGAMGGNGRIVVQKTFERGHEGTASARNPSALRRVHERLREVEADLLQPQTLEAVVEDQDAVISSVSEQRSEGGAQAYDPLLRGDEDRHRRDGEAGRQAFGVPLHQRGRAGPSARDPLRQDMGPLLFKEMYADMRRTEQEVRSSGLDWIVARPSTSTDGPASGGYIVGTDSIPKGRRIPREDVAEFTLYRLDDDR